LVSASVVANLTHADRRAIEGVLSPLLDSNRLASAAVIPAHGSNPLPLEQFRSAPVFSSLPAATRRDIVSRTVARRPEFVVVNLLDKPTRRLGYAYASQADALYVVYGEVSVPANRRSRVETNSAFTDVDYAIYLGPDASSRNLLAASVANPDFDGRTASGNVALGDTSIHVVITPRGELGGPLLPRLPWIIAVVGTLITVAAALMTERLVRRRADAELLAVENAQLFREQRSVAQTLQHSLLPDRLPEIEGLQVAV